MSHPAIRVQNVSKQYQIGTGGQSYGTFREAIVEAAKAPFRRMKAGEVPGGRENSFWALKDVSFDVERGEVLGIIGRNGAGKSTLLKVLSRITEPTTGRLEVRGRVASLLEVGTGFHAELTGRENIFLNGAILGMSRAEIQRNFDQIVQFAEVEKFIDTPVKRYSSGMYLRLAFAVAAHLEPEILVVDEVLAVGDAAFQERCLGKMEEVSRAGRTVLFVSHNMPAVRSLCSRAVQLVGGKLVRDGNSHEVVDAYLRLEGEGEGAERVWADPDTAPGDDQIRLLALRALGPDGRPAGHAYTSQPLTVEMEFDLRFLHSALCVGFELQTADGILLWRTYHNDGPQDEWPVLKQGVNRIRCTIPPGWLNHGNFMICPRVSLHCIKWIIVQGGEIAFSMTTDHARSPLWASTAEDRPGILAPELQWLAE